MGEDVLFVFLIMRILLAHAVFFFLFPLQKLPRIVPVGKIVRLASRMMSTIRGGDQPKELHHLRATLHPHRNKDHCVLNRTHTTYKIHDHTGDHKHNIIILNHVTDHSHEDSPMTQISAGISHLDPLPEDKDPPNHLITHQSQTEEVLQEINHHHILSLGAVNRLPIGILIIRIIISEELVGAICLKDLPKQIESLIIMTQGTKTRATMTRTRATCLM